MSTRTAPQPVESPWETPSTPEPEPEPEPQRLRYNFGASSHATDIVVPDAANCPAAVREASDAVLAAHARYREAAAQEREAQAALRQASAIDAAADRESVALGKPLSDRRAADAAIGAVSAARRRSEAAGENLTSLNYALAHTIRVALPEWRAGQAERIAGLQATAREQCDALLTTLNTWVTEDQVNTTLDRWPEGGSLVGVRFMLGIDDSPSQLIQTVLDLIDPPKKNTFTTTKAW